MNRFARIDGRWGVGGNHRPDRINFKVNRQINIIGFGIYGSVKAARMTGKIEVCWFQINLQLTYSYKKLTRSGHIGPIGVLNFNVDAVESQNFTDKIFRVKFEVKSIKKIFSKQSSDADRNRSRSNLHCISPV